MVFGGGYRSFSRTKWLEMRVRKTIRSISKNLKAVLIFWFVLDQAKMNIEKL